MKGLKKVGPLLAASTALVLAACGTTGGDSDGGSDEASGACGNYKIGFLGATTGDAGALGQNMVGGIKVALDEYNAEHADCKVTLASFDSQGAADQAKNLTSQIIADDKILGVVGPAFSDESNATGPAFAEAGLPTISASATRVSLAQQGWDTFHRVVANDDAQGPADAKYLADTAKATKVFVIDDSEAYGQGLADSVKTELGDKVVGSDSIQQKQTDFSATVTKVTGSGADAVFFGGYYTEAGLIVKALRQAGWTGLFESGDGTLDPSFIKIAGAKAAEGSVITSAAAAPTADFAKKYAEVNAGATPGGYSAEAYDATNVFLAGFADGVDDREGMLDFVNNYDADGITKHIKFTEEGEVGDATIYAYTIKDGAIGAPEAVK